MAKQVDDKPIVDVAEAFSKTELFIEQNKKRLITIVTLVVVVVGGYLAYKYWYIAGEEVKAGKDMYLAEQSFEKDSIDMAINGKGEVLGFTQIVDMYGSTPSGNLAEYYLGVCYLKKGKYEEAIEHLKNFDSKDKIVGPLAIADIGDASMELGKTDEAITYYLKAAERYSNNFDTPICLKKAGMAYEEKQSYADAVKIYERVKNEYPESTEGKEIDKYIARAKVLGNL